MRALRCNRCKEFYSSAPGFDLENLYLTDDKGEVARICDISVSKHPVGSGRRHFRETIDLCRKCLCVVLTAAIKKAAESDLLESREI